MSAHVKTRMTWKDVVAAPENRIYEKRLAQMTRDWGGYEPAIVGSPAIADNTGLAFPELPEDALVVLDGNHRRALAERSGKLDDEFLADVYRELTPAQAHRTRRGLNDRRTVKPAETFLDLVAEGDVTRGQILADVESLGWKITLEREDGGLSCTNELKAIYDRKGGRGAMLRAIRAYEGVWGVKEARAQARVVKGLGWFWLDYPDADLSRLISALTRARISVDGLYQAGKLENDTLPYIKTVHDGIRYVLAVTYNKARRSGQLDLA